MPQYLYVGWLGVPFNDGTLTFKYGRTNNPQRTIARHKRMYRDFYSYEFIQLPTDDWRVARRYEDLLGRRYVEEGMHAGRVAYAGLPRTEIVQLAWNADPAGIFQILRDVAHWAGEADEVLLGMLNGHGS